MRGFFALGVGIVLVLDIVVACSLLVSASFCPHHLHVPSAVRLTVQCVLRCFVGKKKIFRGFPIDGEVYFVWVPRCEECGIDLVCDSYE